MRKKKYTTILLKFSLLVFVSLFVFACGSKKTVSVGGTLAKKTQNELISDVLDKELKYNTVSGKVNLELLPANSKKGVKSGTVVKMIRDSIIQISVRPILGMEVFRITITPDFLHVLDRINKKYAMEEMSKFGQSHNAHFNYYNLQALLTNSLFLPGEQYVFESNYKQFDVSVASDMYVMRTVDKSGMLYNFAVGADDRITSTLIVSPDKNYTLQWSYKDFIEDNKYIYPTQMSANVDINKKRFDVNLSYSKLDINTPVEIDYSVSKKYDKVSLSDMLSGLMKLK